MKESSEWCPNNMCSPTTISTVCASFPPTVLWHASRPSLEWPELTSIVHLDARRYFSQGTPRVCIGCMTWNFFQPACHRYVLWQMKTRDMALFKYPSSLEKQEERDGKGTHKFIFRSKHTCESAKRSCSHNLPLYCPPEFHRYKPIQPPWASSTVQ